MTGPQPEPAPRYPAALPAPGTAGATDSAHVPRPVRLHPAVRGLDTLAGLLSAGMLLVGVVLAVAALVAPSALSAAGLGTATGPGWLRVAAHLAVGVIGELVVFRRRGWSPVARAAADLVVIAAAVVVIGWAWWP